MAGQLIERKRIQGIENLAKSLFEDFKLAGLTQILPTSNANFTPASGKGSFIFESSASINPVQDTQPFRILVELDGKTDGVIGNIKLAIANPQQINPLNTPMYSTFPGGLDTNGNRVMGQLGNAWKPAAAKAGDTFFTRDRINYVIDEGTVYSYTMVTTGHGIALFAWEDAGDDTPAFSWFNVQVPVDKETGVPLTTDNSPIFCVYSCDNESINRFVVSESDIYRPTISVPADEDGVNSNAIINSVEQVGIAKGNTYLINFLSRLNTDRYAYTEELEQICYTSADVIAEDTEVSITAYGEATPRVYRAMKANGANNTKMRILMLVSGGDGPVAE